MERKRREFENKLESQLPVSAASSRLVPNQENAYLVGEANNVANRFQVYMREGMQC